MAILTDAGGEDHFDPDEFDAQLEAHGTPALWRRARTCPCVDPDTGAPNIECPYCLDQPGTLWDDGVPITVFAPARRRKDLYNAAGHLLEGVVTLTFPTSVTPGHLDWIELTAAECVVNRETHKRGELDPLGRSAERLRFPDVLAVESIDAIVGGVLQTYLPDTEFTVGFDASIQWVTGPPAQTLYTVRYVARPVYVCWGPESRDEGGAKQPTRCLAQRLDFFRQPVVGE